MTGNNSCGNMFWFVGDKLQGVRVKDMEAYCLERVEVPEKKPAQVKVDSKKVVNNAPERKRTAETGEKVVTNNRSTNNTAPVKQRTVQAVEKV